MDDWVFVIVTKKTLAYRMLFWFTHIYISSKSVGQANQAWRGILKISVYPIEK